MNRIPSSLIVAALAILACEPISSVAFVGKGGKDDRIGASVCGWERTGPDGRPRRCNDDDIRALGVAYPKLQDLKLGWPGMTDSGLREVAKLTTLESLDVGNSSETVGGKTLETTLTADGWKALGGLNKLQKLRVGNVKLDVKGMEEIGRLRQLKSLDLSYNGVTDAGVEKLAGMKELTHLSVIQFGLTDKSASTILGLQQLESLAVSGLTDETVKQFATLPKLKFFDARDVKVSAEGVKSLSVCKTLRELAVVERQAPPEVLDALRQANRSLSIHITDVGKYLKARDQE